MCSLFGTICGMTAFNLEDMVHTYYCLKAVIWKHGERQMGSHPSLLCRMMTANQQANKADISSSGFDN
jgi:hypothetical protein